LDESHPVAAQHIELLARSSSQLHDVRGIGLGDGEATGAHVPAYAHDAKCVIEKNNVDGKAHADRVDSKATVEPQAFVCVDRRARQQPEISTAPPFGREHVARDHLTGCLIFE